MALSEVTYNKAGTDAKLATKADYPAGGSDGQALVKAGTTTAWTTISTGAVVADATTSAKGILQLAGDLAGTAAAPVLKSQLGVSGSVGTSTQIPVISYNVKGLITAVSAVTVSLPSTLPTTNSQTGTAYTLNLGDAANIVENTGTGALTVTVPLNSSVAYPVGTVIEFCNYSTGSIVLAGAAATQPFVGDTFTGTNGAAWASQWTGLQLNGGAAGTATIQSNAGALYAGTSGAYREYLSGMTAQADTDLLFSITFPTQANANFWACISADNLVAASNGNVPQNAYILFLGENSTAASSTYGLYSIVGNGTANAYTSGTTTITAGTKYTIRFQRSSSIVRFKMWAASGSEPSTWFASATDSSAPLPAGKVSFAVDNTQTVTIDDVSVTTPGLAVTLASPSGFRLTSQYASAAIRKRATDEWIVSGLTVN